VNSHLESLSAKAEALETKNMDAPLWVDYRAVIFDCDDTILATAKTRWMALITAADKFGVKLEEPTIRAAWGKPFDELIAALIPEVTLDQFLPVYQRTMRQFTPEPTPGAVSLLGRLYQKGIRLEIVTSSRRDLILQDLDALNLRHYFADVWGHEQTAPYNKPDPRVLGPVLLRLESEGIFRVSIVYIGDSVRDHEVARGNGLQFIAVTTGLEDTAAFLSAGVAASRVVGSLSEVVAAIPETA
jgi:phosphoglycolate phosphatase-like HAD superfamily hydrolase